MDSLSQLLLSVGVLVLTTFVAEASHFRGGTISWRPINAKEVEFYFKLGWVYGRGPGCTEHKIGQFVRIRSVGTWSCQKGCAKKEPVSDTHYSCIAASSQERWEQGEHKFKHTFAAPTKYSIGFHDSAWMHLSGNKGNGPWNIETEVDLSPRSDTGLANSSPYTLSKALYNVQFGCPVSLRIPVLDPNGDSIRCRWARGSECEAVCNALPGAQLEEETCTISFTPNVTNGYQKKGMYAVALSIEDFPRTEITLNGAVKKTPTDALSLVPLQFLIHTSEFPGPCDSRPQWVEPTPADKEVIVVSVGHALSVPLYADNGNSTVPITGIQVIGPAALKQSKLQQDTSRNNTFFRMLTWNVTQKDIGEEIVCANPMDLTGKAGDSRCFTIKIEMDYCKPRPCLNGGTCTNIINDYSCACPSGFTGKNCHDVLPCSAKPCQNGGSCTNTNNTYSCTCPPGFTGKDCQEVDICSSGPCQNGGTCTSIVNDYSCVCSRGFTGKDCSAKKGFGHCASHQCLHGFCVTNFHGYTCVCNSGWQGKRCAIPDVPSTVPTTQSTARPTTQPRPNPTTQPKPNPITQSSFGSTTQPSSIPHTQPKLVSSTHSSPTTFTQSSSISTMQSSPTPTVQSSVIPTIQSTTTSTIQVTTFPTTQSTTTSTTRPTTTSTTQSTTTSTTPSTTTSTTQSTTIPTTQPTTIPTTQPTTIPTTQSTTIPTQQVTTVHPTQANPAAPTKAPQYPHRQLTHFPPTRSNPVRPITWSPLLPIRVSTPGKTVTYDNRGGAGNCPCVDGGGEHHGHPLEADYVLKDVLIGLFGFLLGVACGLSLYFLVRRCMDRDSDYQRSRQSSRLMDRWHSGSISPVQKVGIQGEFPMKQVASNSTINKLIDW